MRNIPTLIATLLGFGFVLAQNARTEVPPEGMPVQHLGSDSNPGAAVALFELLNLDESQIASLGQVNIAREDEVIPLLREAWEKAWDLVREFRRQQPDNARVDMLQTDIESIRQKIRDVNSKHREMARKHLNSVQFATLVEIESAVELMEAAQQAIHANLIEAPDHLLGDSSELSFLGITGLGLIDGVFGSILERPDDTKSITNEPVASN